MMAGKIVLPRRAIEHAARTHQGRRRDMARTLGVHANTLRREMSEKGLHAMADALAIRGARPGRRDWLTDEAVADDRERLAVALRDFGLAGAILELGLSRATIYRKMREYGFRPIKDYPPGDWRGF